MAVAAEPLSQPSQEANTTVKITPDTYSGVAVVVIEATDKRAVGARALPHAGQDADEQRDRHHGDHHPEHQLAGGAERREQLVGHLGLELGRAAEIALQDAAVIGAPKAPGRS